MRGGEAGAASAGGSRAEARQPSITLACSGRRRCDARCGKARRYKTRGGEARRYKATGRASKGREMELSTLHA
jgi:hypothetical protein